MPTHADLEVSLGDTKFYHQKINTIVRGSEHGIDLDEVRRYFRGYLHCWKTVLHFVRSMKAFDNDENGWKQWCERWVGKHLDAPATTTANKLRELRDDDTHKTTLTLAMERGSAPVGTPLVFVEPVSDHLELVTVTAKGVDILEKLIATYASIP